MNYSKEDYDYVKNFEPQFNTAINSHFVRMDNRVSLAKLDSIYQKIFGRKSNLLGGCNRCVCDCMTKLATLYYKDKAEYEKQAKKEAKNNAIDLIDENCGTTISNSAKTAANKTKTAKNKK